MSKFTTEVRWIVEQELDNNHLTYAEENWKTIYKKLGLHDYPIFDEEHREILNTKIIRRYYFREIGFETAALWAWKMREYMHEIMPYYNKMYESELMITDPLRDFYEKFDQLHEDDKRDDFNTLDTETRDFSDTVTPTGTEKTTVTPRATVSTSNENYNRNVFEDTPQSLLSNTPKSDWFEPTDSGSNPMIGGEQYATNVTYDSGKTVSTTSGVSGEDTTELSFSNRQTQTDYGGTGTRAKTGDNQYHSEGTIDHEKFGYRQTQAELVKKFRDAVLNIDLEIVDRLNELFMGLW